MLQKALSRRNNQRDILGTQAMVDVHGDGTGRCENLHIHQELLENDKEHREKPDDAMDDKNEHYHGKLYDTMCDKKEQLRAKGELNRDKQDPVSDRSNLHYACSNRHAFSLDHSSGNSYAHGTWKCYRSSPFQLH